MCSWVMRILITGIYGATASCTLMCPQDRNNVMVRLCAEIVPCFFSSTLHRMCTSSGLPVPPYVGHVLQQHTWSISESNYLAKGLSACCGIEGDGDYLAKALLKRNGGRQYLVSLMVVQESDRVLPDVERWLVKRLNSKVNGMFGGRKDVN